MSSIASNTAHLFYVRVDGFNHHNLGEQALLLLTDHEKSEMNRYVFKKERDQYLTAKYILRTKLTQLNAKFEPAQWAILRDSHNKPYLDPQKHPDGPFFNISHSKGVVMCAVSGNRSIGIDIEYNKEPIDIMEIAKQNFARQEVEQLESTSPDGRLELFYTIWTLKESYIKAIGTGLSHPLKNFYFELPKKNKAKISFHTTTPNEESHWQFRMLNPYPDYQAAVALRTTVNLDIIETFINFKERPS